MALTKINLDWNREGSRPSEQYDPTARVAGVQLNASPCTLLALLVTHTGGSDGYVQIHDATSAPADTAVPIASLFVEAGKTISLTLPVVCSNGCYVCLSSTAGTKTIGSAEILVLAQIRY